MLAAAAIMAAKIRQHRCVLAELSQADTAAGQKVAEVDCCSMTVRDSSSMSAACVFYCWWNAGIQCSLLVCVCSPRSSSNSSEQAQ